MLLLTFSCWRSESKNKLNPGQILDPGLAYLFCSGDGFSFGFSRRTRRWKIAHAASLWLEKRTDNTENASGQAQFLSATRLSWSRSGFAGDEKEPGAS